MHIAEPVKDPISGYPNYSLFRFNCQPYEAAAVAARHWHNAQKLDELIDYFVYVYSWHDVHFNKLSFSLDCSFYPGPHMHTVLAKLAVLGYATPYQGGYRWSPCSFGAGSALRLEAAGHPAQAGQLYDQILASIAAEPCVLERDQDVQALMNAPHRLRKGMAPR